MINEYALDPDKLCDWSTFRHVALGMGFANGRVISEFPKHWKRKAYERAKELNQNTRKKIETWLADCAGDFLVDNRKGFPYEPERGWFQNAYAEHERMPFHAIITDHSDNAEAPTMDIRQIGEDNSLWQVQKQMFVARNAREIGPLVGRLLRYAKRIRVVDPYFAADPEQMAILVACLPKTFGPKPDIELHVDGQKCKPAVASQLIEKVRNELPQDYSQPKVVRWQEGYLHNRFFLTDRGGIMMGDSIKKHESRPDQLTLLEKEVYIKWWAYHDPAQHADQIASE